jgi:hypothetical protein
VRDCREGIIKDNMELSGDGLGRGVQDQGNETGVHSGEANIDTLSAPRSPLGNLDSILSELGFKNKGGTSSYMTIAKGVSKVDGSGASPHLHGRKPSIRSWNVVIQPHSMVHGLRPKILVDLRPTVTQCCMQQHCPGHIGNGKDGALSNTILMCSSRSSKPDLLALRY